MSLLNLALRPGIRALRRPASRSALRPAHLNHLHTKGLMFPPERDQVDSRAAPHARRAARVLITPDFHANPHSATRGNNDATQALEEPLAAASW